MRKLLDLTGQVFGKLTVVPCCSECNMCKQRKSYDEWVFVGKAIKQFREQNRED